MSAQFNRLFNQASVYQRGGVNPRRARVSSAFGQSVRQRGLSFLSDRNKKVGTGRFANVSG